ncbi:MAG: glycoside hydrolase family 43 protein [Bacteroides sp.]|nr:glycoside hydrolase family 43 protein [Bacteroides sp.]
MKTYVLLISLFIFCASCSNKGSGKKELPETAGDTFVNPLFSEGTDPSAVLHNGTYYYTHGTENQIMLWQTRDITDMAHAECKVVWKPQDPVRSFHLWAPEIHYIDNKWYIYYAADDGNTDNHQLYVLESPSPNPMEGEFHLKGPIMTNPEWNWGIQATTFEHRGVRYLVWSGWPKRRSNAETQCIYITRMKDPWTLDTPRVMISKPEYEWERQWVNPDGSRTAYPIYVNEGPQYFHSKDNKTIIIYYAASDSWTPYYCLGMLTADADSDLLDPASWTKHPAPVFKQLPERDVYGPGGISFIPSPDSTEWYMLYHTRKVPNGDTGSPETRSIRLQKMAWDEDGMPQLGEPVGINIPLPKPSGTAAK